jgi:hypothetical protein
MRLSFRSELSQYYQSKASTFLIVQISFLRIACIQRIIVTVDEATGSGRSPEIHSIPSLTFTLMITKRPHPRSGRPLPSLQQALVEFQDLLNLHAPEQSFRRSSLRVACNDGFFKFIVAR